MRFLVAVGLVVATVLGGLPAGASHTSSQCTASNILATPSAHPLCKVTISCPANSPHPCTWTLSLTVSGYGFVSGRILDDPPSGPGAYEQCSGLNACSAAGMQFPLPPGGSKTFQCRGDNFTMVAAVSMQITCRATV